LALALALAVPVSAVPESVGLVWEVPVSVVLVSVALVSQDLAVLGSSTRGHG
jgi:hypothetical protein